MNNADRKSRSAIALTYDQESAPTISAKGSGELAEQIITLAQQSNIPLMENAYLVELLLALDMGDEIPEELYLSIAEIIAFAYWISEKSPNIKSK